MKRKFKILFGVAVGLALMAAPFVYAVEFHNRQVAELQDEVAALPHPSNSALVARLGDIAGNSDGHPFVYWTFELRSFSGSGVALAKHYQGLRVPIPASLQQGAHAGAEAVDFEVLPSPLPSGWYVPVGTTQGCWLGSFAGQKNLYLVKVVTDGNNNSLATKLDLRCTP